MFRLRGRSQTEPDSTQVEGQAVSRGESPDLETLHDERLACAAQAGDLPSFNALVTRHERPVYNLCLRMLRDVAAAEDATQDTFVKAWSSLGSFRGGLVRPWLLKIATNRCYDLLRAQGRRPSSSLDAEPIEVQPRWTSQARAEDPEGFSARSELAAHLEQALGQLPDDQRLVLILSDIQGHDYDEIAEIAGVPIGTVKSRLSRARARLRNALREDPASRELFGRFTRLSDE